MSEDWQSYVQRIEDLAGRAGLSFHPVDFEAVPRFLHDWKSPSTACRCGCRTGRSVVRYIYSSSNATWETRACSRSCFPGNPGHAYLAASNGLAENILVTAHVLGHADFSRNNLLFRRCKGQVSERIVEHAANHARQIQQAIGNLWRARE